jgi:hypothetical protein
VAAPAALFFALFRKTRTAVRWRGSLPAGGLAAILTHPERRTFAGEPLLAVLFSGGRLALRTMLRSVQCIDVYRCAEQADGLALDVLPTGRHLQRHLCMRIWRVACAVDGVFARHHANHQYHASSIIRPRGLVWYLVEFGMYFVSMRFVPWSRRSL